MIEFAIVCAIVGIILAIIQGKKAIERDRNNEKICEDFNRSNR